VDAGSRVDLGSRGGASLGVRIFLTGSAGSVIWVATWVAVSVRPSIGLWLYHVMIPAGTALLIALLMVRQRQNWACPVQRLGRLVPADPRRAVAD